MLFVDASCLPIHIGWVVVRIQYLEFVASVTSTIPAEEYTTVSAPLACTLYANRNTPLTVQLVVDECSPGLYISCSLLYHKYISGSGPGCCLGCIPGGNPFRKTVAAK